MLAKSRVIPPSADLARFWAKVEKRPEPNGCWIWTGAIRHGGHGAVRVCNVGWLAHRLSWTIEHGPIPDRMCVLHNCPTGDNPACVNPAHFYLGTQEENTQDMIRKGQLHTGPRPLLWPKKPPRPRLSPIEYLWANVYLDATQTGCWLWTGPNAANGYGGFCNAGSRAAAHRRAWQLLRGPVPEGLFVLHKCDAHYPPGDMGYRRCVNPDHLWLGTKKQNSEDMVKKRRNQYGDRHFSRRRPEWMARGDRNGSRLHPDRLRRGEGAPGSKLTAEQVTQIRRDYADRTSTQKALAERYGVCRAAICHIVKRKVWRHLP